jgi:RES domain-containing protein
MRAHRISLDAGRPEAAADERRRIAEAQDAAGQPIRSAVDASTILDLTALATRRDLGLDNAFLRQPWKRARDVEGRRPSCWDFVASAAASGWQGLRVPSAQAPGTNLVLWRWNEPDGAHVRHLDPLNDFTRYQTSWSGR